MGMENNSDDGNSDILKTALPAYVRRERVCHWG